MDCPSCGFDSSILKTRIMTTTIIYNCTKCGYKLSNPLVVEPSSKVEGSSVKVTERKQIVE